MHWQNEWENIPRTKATKKVKIYQTAFRLDLGSYKQTQCKSNIITSNQLQYKSQEIEGTGLSVLGRSWNCILYARSISFLI